MLTCKEASFLASKKLDGKLSFAETIQFKLHTLLCGFCRRYAAEISKLHTMMKKAGKSSDSILPDSVKLPEESRERIKQCLDKASSVDRLT